MHCHRPGSKGESKDVSKLRWTDQERSSHRTYSSPWDLGSSDHRVRKLLTNIQNDLRCQVCPQGDPAWIQ